MTVMTAPTRMTPRANSIADVVPADLDVHQARYGLVVARVAVVAQALDEGGSAVSDADDTDPDLLRAQGNVHSTQFPCRTSSRGRALRGRMQATKRSRWGLAG